MRFAASLLVLSAFIVTPVLANNALRSDGLKKQICAVVEEDVARHDRATRFDSKACAAGEFTIVSSARDPRTRETTLMQIRYVFVMGQLAIKGHAQLAASSKPDRTGAMVKTWGVRDTRTTFNDSRDIIARIQEELSNDNSNVDVGNGDHDIRKVPGYTVAKAKRDLQRSRPSRRGSCQFETTEGIDYVLGDHTLGRSLEQSNLASLLKLAKSQGKIKGAVMRLYEDGGDSEYCSLYKYVIIFTDETVLSFNLDFTT